MNKHCEAQHRWRLRNPTYQIDVRRTFEGFFRFTFSRMKSRCKKGSKDFRYWNFPIMSQNEWNDFLIETLSDRKKLFDAWVESGYKIDFAPSIDRINPDEGYLRNNCQWLSHKENSGKRRNAKEACRA